MLEVVKKEIRQLIRDKRTLGLVILQPIVVILFFGFCIYHDVSNVNTFVFMQESGNYSQDIIDVIEESEAFHITRHVNSASEVYDAVENGKARVFCRCC